MRDERAPRSREDGNPNDGADPAGREGRLLKLTLIGTFFASVLAVGRERRQAPLGMRDLLLVGLASHRIGRMMAFERVAEPLRAPFTATVPDDSGVDETVVARGHGLRWVLGELLSCPTCVATWSALALTIGRSLVPGPTQMLVNVLAIVGVAELTTNAVEDLEWRARAHRRKAGAPSGLSPADEPVPAGSGR